MALYDFKLPDIGEGVVEGEIVKWLVKAGDEIKEDQPMVEVMTDKATVTIPSPKKGRVLQTYGKEGEIAKVHAINALSVSRDEHDRTVDVAALLRDLKQRGLLDSTLVVWASEFGRTPLGENRPGFASVTGRDHHPFAFSVWMAGGGVKGGQVIGQTDDLGWGIVQDPIHINDFHATILHLFGLDHTRLTYRFHGRDFRLTDIAGKVVNKVLA